MKKILLILTICFTLLVNSAEKPKKKLSDILPTDDAYYRIKEQRPELILLAELLHGSMENITSKTSAAQAYELFQQYKKQKTPTKKFDDSDLELNKILEKIDVLFKNAYANLKAKYPQLVLLTELQGILENATSETSATQASKLVIKSKELIKEIKEWAGDDQVLNGMLAEIDKAGDAILADFQKLKDIAAANRRDLDSAIEAAAQADYEAKSTK